MLLMDVAQHRHRAVVVTRRVSVLAQHAAVTLAPLQVGYALQVCPGQAETGQATYATALQVSPGNTGQCCHW